MTAGGRVFGGTGPPARKIAADKLLFTRAFVAYNNTSGLKRRGRYKANYFTARILTKIGWNRAGSLRLMGVYLLQRDYYQVLGVGPDADDKEIKKAYRTIIRYCHPDSPDCRMTKDELLEVQEAYETLADPQKRARYDRGRDAPRQEHTGRAGAPAAARRRTPRGSFAPDDMFSDIFSLFRDPLSDSAFSRGGEHGFIGESDLEITLTSAEARRGGSFEIAIPSPGGIPTGTIVIRVAPGVRSGTETTVDLGEMLGVRQRIRITIVVEDDGR